MDIKTPAHWYDRYMGGSFVQVWREMSPFCLLELDEHSRSEAQAVLKETMDRVARNIEVLASRLSDLGYRPLSILYVPATLDSNKALADLQALVGGLPESLKSLYARFESVNFMGNLDPLSFYLEADSADPRYSAVQSDPFVIVEAQRALKELSELAEFGDLTIPLRDRCVLPLAPDKLHKHGYSGDEPIGVLVPDSRIDGLWGEPETPFIDYLRFSILDWGGFPGFREAPVVPAALQSLREGLLPF